MGIVTITLKITQGDSEVLHARVRACDPVMNSGMYRSGEPGSGPKEMRKENKSHRVYVQAYVCHERASLPSH